MFRKRSAGSRRRTEKRKLGSVAIIGLLVVGTAGAFWVSNLIMPTYMGWMQSQFGVNWKQWDIQRPDAAPASSKGISLQ